MGAISAAAGKEDNAKDFVGGRRIQIVEWSFASKVHLIRCVLHLARWLLNVFFFSPSYVVDIGQSDPTPLTPDALTSTHT
jgi:hypothetical protein